MNKLAFWIVLYVPLPWRLYCWLLPMAGEFAFTEKEEEG